MVHIDNFFIRFIQISLLQKQAAALFSQLHTHTHISVIIVLMTVTGFCVILKREREIGCKLMENLEC